MIMTNEEAINKIYVLISTYEDNIEGMACSRLSLVNVAINRRDILALQIAIHSIASLSKLKEVLYDTRLCAEEKEDRLICMLSRPVVDLDIMKAGDPDAH